MSENTETNPTPAANSPAEVDWSTPEQDEVRLPPPAKAPEDEPDPDNAVVEGADEPEKAAAEEDDPIGDDPEEEGEGDDTPDFWAKEDKEFWKQVPPELKPILKKYEQQRIEFANQKAQEAAVERKKAQEEATKVIGANEQYAQWWQANEATFVKTFVDRYAGVNWDVLATENPAEWARLTQQRANEHQMLTQAKAQADHARSEVVTRAKHEEQQARKAAHAQLAKDLPKEFGTPEAADKAYKVLGNYIFEQLRQDYPNAPIEQLAERVNAVYEPSIVKMARKAYKYDLNLARAKELTNPKQGQKSASTTPTRVVPGARSSANPVNDATRQAEERLRNGERSGPDLALAFR